MGLSDESWTVRSSAKFFLAPMCTACMLLQISPGWRERVAPLWYSETRKGIIDAAPTKDQECSKVAFSRPHPLLRLKRLLIRLANSSRSGREEFHCLLCGYGYSRRTSILFISASGGQYCPRGVSTLSAAFSLPLPSPSHPRGTWRPLNRCRVQTSSWCVYASHTCKTRTAWAREEARYRRGAWQPS